MPMRLECADARAVRVAITQHEHPGILEEIQPDEVAPRLIARFEDAHVIGTSCVPGDEVVRTCFCDDIQRFRACEHTDGGGRRISDIRRGERTGAEPGDSHLEN